MNAYVDHIADEDALLIEGDAYRIPSCFTADPRTKLICLFLYTVALFVSIGFATLGLCAVVALALVATSGVTAKEIRRSLKPLLFILLVTLIAQILYCQSGEALFSVGSFTVYFEGLVVSVFMIVRLICLMAVGIEFMHAVTTRSLIGTLSWTLAPLRRLGLRVDTFVLALDVALQILPLFIREIDMIRAGEQSDQRNKNDAEALNRLRHRIAHLKGAFIQLLESSFDQVDIMAERFVHKQSISSCPDLPAYRATFAPPDAGALILFSLLLGAAFLI